MKRNGNDGDSGDDDFSRAHFLTILQDRIFSNESFF